MLGHALVENCIGLQVDFQIVEANGSAMRSTVIEVIDQVITGNQAHRLGRQVLYDIAALVTTCRALKVAPHFTADDRPCPGGSGLGRRRLRHAGYVINEQKHKRMEEIFGWIKTIFPTSAAPANRGRELTQCAAYLMASAYN